MFIFRVILIRMRENVDQNNSEYGHFSRSDCLKKNYFGSTSLIMIQSSKRVLFFLQVDNFQVSLYGLSQICQKPFRKTVKFGTFQELAQIITCVKKGSEVIKKNKSIEVWRRLEWDIRTRLFTQTIPLKKK